MMLLLLTQTAISPRILTSLLSTATAGCNLILVARRREKLQEIADAVTARGLPVNIVIDLTIANLHRRHQPLFSSLNNISRPVYSIRI